MHMDPVFFADMANVKARQTSTMNSTILACPCGDRETFRRHLREVYPTPHDERSSSPAPVSSTSAVPSGAPARRG